MGVNHTIPLKHGDARSARVRYFMALRLGRPSHSYY